MKIVYMEWNVNSSSDVCTAKRLKSIEFCCEKMGENLVSDNDFQLQSSNGVSFKGEIIEFCPYCGKEVHLSHLGKYIFHKDGASDKKNYE